MIATLKRYWPWWVALVWLCAYELYALATPATTLSRLAWHAQLAWPPLPYLATGAAVVLSIHFWLRNRVKQGK